MFLFTLWEFHSYDIFWSYHPLPSSSQTSPFLLAQLHASHYFLRQRLSLYWELTRIARLAGSKPPGLLLPLLLQSCDHRCWSQPQGGNSNPPSVMLSTSQAELSPQPTLCTFKATAPMTLLDSFFPLDMTALRCYERWIRDCPRETRGRTQPLPLGFSQFQTCIWFHFKRPGKFLVRKGENVPPQVPEHFCEKWYRAVSATCSREDGAPHSFMRTLSLSHTPGKLTASLFLSFHHTSLKT